MFILYIINNCSKFLANNLNSKSSFNDLNSFDYTVWVMLYTLNFSYMYQKIFFREIYEKSFTVEPKSNIEQMKKWDISYKSLPGSDFLKSGKFVTSFVLENGAQSLGNINRTSQPVINFSLNCCKNFFFFLLPTILRLWYCKKKKQKRNRIKRENLDRASVDSFAFGCLMNYVFFERRKIYPSAKSVFISES